MRMHTESLKRIESIQRQWQAQNQQQGSRPLRAQNLKRYFLFGPSISLGLMPPMKYQRHLNLNYCFGLTSFGLSTLIWSRVLSIVAPLLVSI